MPPAHHPFADLQLLFVDLTLDHDVLAVTCGGEDCDDLDPNVFPGATEACNGVDDDCNGSDDDAADGDGDGATVCDDCDDADRPRFLAPTSCATASTTTATGSCPTTRRTATATGSGCARVRPRAAPSRTPMPSR